MRPRVTPFKMRAMTHVVWTLDPVAGWGTEGAPQSEVQASQDARSLKALGMQAVALPVGKEPEKLHPADLGIKVVA